MTETAQLLDDLRCCCLLLCFGTELHGHSGVTSLVAAADRQIRTTLSIGENTSNVTDAIKLAAAEATVDAAGGDVHVAASANPRLAAGTAGGGAATAAIAVAGSRTATTVPSSTISDVADLAAGGSPSMAAQLVLQADVASSAARNPRHLPAAAEHAADEAYTDCDAAGAADAASKDALNPFEDVLRV